MNDLSIWELESFFAPADVIIAGSGFVGLWSAYYLKKLAPELTVTILERGLIPTGASTRNAGFACFGSLTELMADADKMGEDKMMELVTMRYKGLRRINKLFSKKEIGFEHHGGYELIAEDAGAVTSTPEVNTLRSQIDRFNHLLKKTVKMQKTFRMADRKIAEFGFSGIRHLVENVPEAQLHSGRLCQALLRLVQSMGVTVLNNIEIRGYEKRGSHLRLHTNLPISFTTSQLLVCTNAFARQLLPQLDIVPARGQVLVTSPIEGLPFKGTFHFEEGFYYFRDLGNRVLLGGARNKAFEAETTEEMTTTTQIQDELERFLKDVILPGRQYTIEHRWSGIMGMGNEKMPIVQVVDHQICCAVRMSGMGVALAPIVGEKVARLMTGKDA
jgi:glycine/D-amino acid oxidase-like deaminating enzyme